MVTMVRSKMTGPVRIVVLGGEKVGKSAVTVRFLTRRFIGEYNSEIDMLYQYNLMMDDCSIDMEILDACHSEENEVAVYDTLNWCQAIVIVYSICDKESFSRAKRQIQLAQKAKAPSYVPILLLGNMTDLDHRRQVDYSEGYALSRQYGCLFYEVSAADDERNISAAFHTLVRDLTSQVNNSRCIKKAGRKNSFVQVSKALASMFSTKTKTKEIERKPSL